MSELIEGIVSSIVYTNAENGYTVLKLDTPEGLITAAGFMPGVAAGERLQISGAWGTHSQYGQQFTTEHFEVKPPTGAEDIYYYLASGAVKNIGPGRAREIVDKFGADSLVIIDTDPDRLAEIKGISLRTARKIGSEYQRQAGLRRLITFLRSYDIKPFVATRIYKDLGDASYDAVRDNPYLITDPQYGAKFTQADTIALDLGFESDCPERISAAIIFLLIHNLGNGHTFIPRDKLTAASAELIGISTDSIPEVFDELCLSGDIVIDTVAGLKACYLRHIHTAECYIAERLKLAAAGKTGLASKSLVKLAQKRAEATHGGELKYSQLQQSALMLSAQHSTLVLTGGPGTGKTTTVRAIMSLFNEAGLKTHLCAPTGRAAKRLSQLCGSEAATIHRLLGASLDESGEHIFEYNELNRLEADALIVDEASMIDILLMEALLRAIPERCRIVLVGDADQLPPIGPGNMFTDVINSGAVPVVVLTEIFRQAGDSGIVRCAHSVNNGIMPDLKQRYPDLFFMPRQSGEQIAQTIAEVYAERLPKNMGIELSQIQVLSPTRKHAAGTKELNKLLREKLNPPRASSKEKQVGDLTFRVGDKVMQIKNNYDILWKSTHPAPAGTGQQLDGAGIFNGDTGIILEIDHVKETLTVEFEDKLVKYTFEQLSELEPAFAVTVHKSQGSEYHAVILAMTNAAPQLLTRAVLYTAMTRAKALLIIIGSAEVMKKMIDNDKRQKRYSGLKLRLTACS